MVMFDCANGSWLGQYTNTTKEIAIYVATTFKNGSDVWNVIADLCILAIKLPNDLPTLYHSCSKFELRERDDECRKKI